MKLELLASRTMCRKIIVISSQDTSGKSIQIADWSDLQTEILELIFRKLSFLDILHCRAVCSSWCSAARSYISSPRTQAPWLTLPSRLSLFSLAEKKFYNVNRWFYGAWSWCRGSSHGWLVIVDKKKKAHLFNPCTEVKDLHSACMETKFLLIKRFCAHCVTREGVMVEHEEFRRDDLILPYKTLQFFVYKLDFNGKKWDRVESVGDRALFVGGNETLSVSTREFPEFEENSIYFTDDNWTMMEGFYPLRNVQYGGPDNGVYNLRDGSIKSILMDEGDNIRIKPPPLWIVPNPW